MLYERYADRLYNYFIKMLWKNKELAGDKTQQLFLAVWEKSETFDHGRIFKTWIFSMAHNLCKNEYRYYAQKTFTDVEPFKEILQGGVTRDAESMLDDKMIKKHLDHLLEILDEETKHVFVLRYYEELSIKEIASLMQLPEGTVKSKIFYSLKKLKERLTS